MMSGHWSGFQPRAARLWLADAGGAVRCVVGWALAGLAVGCAHTAPVTLGPEYFKHNRSGYELIYAGSGPEQALGPDYRLDNYEARGGSGGNSQWSSRRGSSEVFGRRHDLDDDGVTDVTMTELIDDLRFTQKAGEGVVWLRSITLAAALSEKSLEVLAHRYQGRIRREGVPMPRFGEALPSEVAVPQYEVKLLQERACEVANLSAYQLDLEVRPRAGGGEQRVRLVFVKPGYERTVQVNTGKGATYPVILLAAYRNGLRAFAAGTEGLDVLLDNLALGKGQRAHTCRPEPATGVPEPGSEELPTPAASEGDNPES